MRAVGSRPTFKLRIGVILKDVVPEVDPTELTVIMIPFGPLRRPRPPCERCSLEVSGLVCDSWVVVRNHARQSGISRVSQIAGSESISAGQTPIVKL